VRARGRGITAQAVLATTPWVHRSLGITRIWLKIQPANEPSLRVARRAGYRFEQRLARHCRDWACDDAEQDSWHDCLIWAHEWSANYVRADAGPADEMPPHQMPHLSRRR
jgi:RimJ/RimL family protein N-acetyltransferase